MHNENAVKHGRCSTLTIVLLQTICTKDYPRKLYSVTVNAVFNCVTSHIKVLARLAGEVRNKRSKKKDGQEM